MSDELKRLLSQVHDGITTFDFDGTRIPCIVLEEARYDRLLSWAAGRPLLIKTNMDIVHDGLGHVFVKIALSLSEDGMTERFLVNAKTHLEFFESLADTVMLALSSPRSQHGKGNILMIQLPNRDKAQNVLKIIQKALASSPESYDAVTGI